MPVADKVSVELDARFGRYESEVRRLRGSFDQGMAQMARSASRMERSVEGSVGNLRQHLLAGGAAFAGAFSVQAAVSVADAYTKFTNQLRLAGLEGQNLLTIERALFAQAQGAGVQLEALGTLYGRLAQTQRELGASQEQMLQFTQGVTNALRVNGASAEASRGALLQLSQALGGAIVRAEEFNSINEGARPILQAVANGIDRFGGSVSRLRAEVIDGKVTSQEFFQGFLRGSGQLANQAENASLTISQSMQILENALVLAVGKLDDTLQASERLGAGIKFLADNLELLGVSAAVIATIMGAKMAAGMALSLRQMLLASAASVRAQLGADAYALAQTRLSLATLRASGGQAAFTAAVSRSAVAMGVAQAAASRLGGAMVAMVGGPVGAFFIALALTVGGLAAEAVSASADLRQLEEATDAAGEALKSAAEASRSTAASTEDVGNKSLAAAMGVQTFAGQVGVAAQKLWDMAAAAKAAAINALMAERAALAAERSENQRRMPGKDGRHGALQGPWTPANIWGHLSNRITGDAAAVWTGGQSDRDREAALNKADARLAEMERDLRRMMGQDVADFYRPPMPAAGGDDDKDKKKGRKGADEAARAARDAKRAADNARELAFLRQSVAIEEARLAGDEARARQLERQVDTLALAARYEDLGLDAATARAAAEADSLRLQTAQQAAAARRAAAIREEAQIEAANLADKYELVRALEDARFLREQTLRYQREELTLTQAQAAAQADLLAIQNARAAAQAKALEDSRAEFEIQLARASGNGRRADTLERARRRRERVDELRRGGMGPISAEQQADVEEQAMLAADLKGQIKEAVTAGLWTAVREGEVWDWLEGRLDEIGQRMFERGVDEAIDRLWEFAGDFAMKLFDPSGANKGGGWGGFLNAVTSAFGGGGTGGGKASGGRVYRGIAYPVNERSRTGSETFIPDSSGIIVPQGGASPPPKVSLGLKVVNNGPPMRATMSEDAGGDMRLNLEPLMNRGMDQYVKSGRLQRSMRGAPGPVRRA